jgi:hypothetical protein
VGGWLGESRGGKESVGVEGGSGRSAGVGGGRHCTTACAGAGCPVGVAAVGPLSWAGPTCTMPFCN